MHWRFENKHNLCLIFQRENSNKSYMKIIRVFCLIAILAEMTVLSGEEATLSFTPTDVSQIGQDLSNPDTYGLTSLITDSTDITVNYTIPSVTSGNNPYNTGRITKFAEDLTANNFTFNINFGNNLWDVYVLNVSENKRVSLNSVSYNIIDSATSHPINNITVSKGGLFEVKGDLVVSDRRTTRSWYQTRLNFWGSGNVNINGNLTLSSEMETMYDNALNGVKLELSETNSFTVGGDVTLQSIWKDKKWIRLNSNTRNVFERSFGGLNVASGGVIELDGQSNVTATTLTFTNSGRNEFNGSLATRIEVERTDGKISSWGNVVDNKLNITMDASDPQNGYQVLRFSKIDNYENENWINYAFTSGANSLNEIVVKNGRLDIAMYDGMKASSLSMEGGVFSAAGDNSEMGKVVFDKIVFSGGTIYFDIFELENDSLKINGSIEKVSDSSKLTLEMSVNEYDLREWLAGEDSKSVELITFSSEGSNVTAEDFSLKLLDGVSGEIAMDEADGMISLSVNLGLVPEPEAVASVLAALAIVAACFRKRA